MHRGWLAATWVVFGDENDKKKCCCKLSGAASYGDIGHATHLSEMHKKNNISVWCHMRKHASRLSGVWNLVLDHYVEKRPAAQNMVFLTTGPPLLQRERFLCFGQLRKVNVSKSYAYGEP